MPRDGVDVMKKQPKTIRKKTKRSNPPKDLTGKRFGSWVVLESFGNQMWLCRCDCGMQKNVYESNLISKRSTKCHQCSREKSSKRRTKTYLIWSRLKRSGLLCKKWGNYEIFIKAVGDPPSNDARLWRYNNNKPHAPGNTYWLTFKESPNRPQMSEDLKEQAIIGNKILMKIRKAKNRDEKIRCMITARKAGHTFDLIGLAAGLSRQRVHQIVKKHLRT